MYASTIPETFTSCGRAAGVEGESAACLPPHPAKIAIDAIQRRLTRAPYAREHVVSRGSQAPGSSNRTSRDVDETLRASAHLRGHVLDLGLRELFDAPHAAAD